jgi:Fur family ferric uptake transcriptional regulator
MLKPEKKSKIRKEKKTFREFLLSRSLKLTKEREVVLDEVVRRRGHFDPEELHYALREVGSKVSRASIYRTIPLLQEAGIIEQVENTDKHAHYELVLGKEHHDHMLCTSCGKVIEFMSSEIESLQDRLCKEHGFSGIAHTLEIRGFCKKCAKKKEVST